MPRPLFSALGIAPTAEQLALQGSDDNAIIVHANAGAAKTTSLALCIAERLARGLAPASLLALTYSEPAIEALRASLLKIGVEPSTAKAVWISSFERFASYCLKDKDGATPRLIKAPEELSQTIWSAVANLRETRNHALLERLWLPPAGDSEFVERFLRASLRSKGMLSREIVIWDGRKISQELADEIEEDFTHLYVLAAYERLRCPPEADHPRFRAPHDAVYDLARFIGDPEQPQWLQDLPKWPLRINALMIDEMHDLNRAMFTIVRELLRRNPRCRFIGVGDVDQVIHASAGADERFMRLDEFEKETGRQVRPMKLTASFRFSNSLALCAGNLAGKPYKSSAQHATAVTCVSYQGDVQCAQKVAQAALQWRKDKRPMSDFIVLLRHPHQSILIENALLDADMAYKTKGFETYLHRPEVMLVRVLLALASDNLVAVHGAETRRRLVEELVSFCQVELSYQDDADETQRSRLREAIKSVTLDPATLKIFFEAQLLNYSAPHIVQRLQRALAATRTKDGGNTFTAMIDALDMPGWAALNWVEKQRQVDAVAHLEGLKMAAESFGSAEDFFNHLNDAELKFEKLRARSSKLARKSELCLADIASVKALEFEHVVIPFLAQGEFPSSERESMGDERNLMYVAITRARGALTLIGSARSPSQFVADLKLPAD